MSVGVTLCLTLLARHFNVKGKVNRERENREKEREERHKGEDGRRPRDMQNPSVLCVRIEGRRERIPWVMVG